MIYLPLLLRLIHAMTVPVWHLEYTCLTFSALESMTPIAPFIIPQTRISLAALVKDTTSPPRSNDSIRLKLDLDQRLTLKSEEAVA